MKKLYIVGAGGFGKEVLNLVFECLPEYDFKGYIDIGKISEIKLGNKSYPVLDQNKDLSNLDLKNSAIVIAIGNPLIIKNIVNFYKEKGVSDFPNIVHPLAYVAHSVSMGKGNIVTQNCSISVDVSIGNFNIVNLNSTIGHDVKIGDYNIINPGSNISGGVIIENENLFGTNCTILQYLTIGNHNTIGAGSMNTRNIENNAVLIGNPARIMKINKNE